MKKRRLTDYDTSGQAGITETFGAILFMLFNGLKKDYKYYYDPKFQTRNMILGYIVSIVLFIAFLLLGIWLVL